MPLQLTELPYRHFVSLPVMGSAMCGTTGFQSPADDYDQARIDLAKELVTTLASVFCMRAHGTSMTRAGINDGDILVLDRARTPRTGDIVVADVHDLRVLKRLRVSRGRCFLVAEGDDGAAITVDPEVGVVIVGVLMHTVRSY